MELGKESVHYDYVGQLVDRTKYPYFYFKRIFDVIFSLFLLITTSPIMIITCLATIIEDKGTPFYFQERVGHLGKKIKIIKLRSMYLDAEKNGAQWAKKDDDRVTRVGHFIRKTRIDELPQLINVLKGDMNLIGPRPEREVFVEQFCMEIDGFEKRLEVRPGLTGLAQVSGGYDHTPKEKLEYDKKYIENYSLKQDIVIFFKTIMVVLNGEGAR